MRSLIARACPVCGHNEALPYLQKGELHLVQCRRCAMVYANPVPAEFASGEHYERAGRDYYLIPAKLESDYAAVRFERELRLFRKHCRRGAVLDVGCSTGAFLFQLRSRFPGDYQILGADASGPALDYAASRGVPVARGDFLKTDLGRGEFDAVTFWAVLEHLAEPKAFLEKAWSTLKPGGLCFLLVPNLGSLAARLLGARYRYVYPQHLNYFTRATLAKLIEPHFQTVEVRCTHFNPVVIWQDWRRGGREVSNDERAELLKRTTGYKQRAWLKPARIVYRIAERALGAVGLADNLAVVLRRKN